jgi:hypothetical protein
MTPDTVEPKPWHRQPLVWLVIGIPLSAIIAGFITLGIALQSDHSPVADDYYKRGLAMNRDLSRLDAARALGLTAQVRLAASVAEVRLASREGAPLPAQLTLRLTHATLPGHDQALSLMQIQPGEYRAALPVLKAGRYNLVLESGPWKLLGGWQDGPDWFSLTAER